MDNDLFDLELFCKLIRLLSSDLPGEVASATHAAGRMLNGAGLSWHDVADYLAGTSSKLEDIPPQKADLSMIDALLDMPISAATRRFGDVISKGVDSGHGT